EQSDVVISTLCIGSKEYLFSIARHCIAIVHHLTLVRSQICGGVGGYIDGVDVAIGVIAIAARCVEGLPVGTPVNHVPGILRISFVGEFFNLPTGPIQDSNVVMR